MSRRIRSLFLATVFTLAFSYTGERSVAADDAVSICNSGSLVAASLKINGEAAQLNTSGGFALTVCRILSGDQQMYSVLVGLYDSGVLREDLTSVHADKTFEVTFTPIAGDIPTTADFYGKVTSFSASSPVVVAVQPAKNISFVQYGNHSECRGVEYTNAQCIALPASVDRAAVVLGQIRFDTSSRPSNYSKLAGATVSATANLYDFSLLGPCPTATSGFTGTDSGDGGLDRESTTLNIKLAGPHFKFDGATLNSGALEVFIPQSTITSCFGGSSEQLANTAAVTRTEGNESKDVLKSVLTPINGLEYTTSFANGGLKLSIPAVTFSQPTYKVVLKKTIATTSTTTTTTAPTTALTPVIPAAKPIGVTWKIAARKLTISTKLITGLKYKVRAVLQSVKKTQKSGTCKTGKTLVTCTIILAKGSWRASLTPIRGTTAGATAAKTFLVR
jgi:hypothetical protein